MNEKFYKISEVVKLLGISKPTLYNWEKQGLLKIQRSKSGGLNFISQSELDKNTK
jgi:DNA-binding transcriptional MerR regulator